MSQLLIPFTLSDGKQEPILAYSNDQHLLVFFSSARGTSTISEHAIKQLKTFPVGFDLDTTGVPVPRYVLDLRLIPTGDRVVNIKRLRLYREATNEDTPMVCLGADVVSINASIPPFPAA